MSNEKHIKTPITDEIIKTLKVKDIVYITGTIYTARDAAHKKLAELINNNEQLPFDFNGQAVYYAGPTPAKPNQPIGSVGPTTSGRMDAYSPLLISNGLKIMIGKGFRSNDVIDSIKKYNGVYLATIGGAAALIAKSVKKVEVIAFSYLETEAIRKLEVVDFPCVVAIDCCGNNIYEN